jgi:hypothetical protein
MNRRLLPYEYQLIEALGVSKEEYLEFVALQQEYKDPKAGTALDIRGADGGATLAIVLTIVGILFQVGAALLAPKPTIPGLDNDRRTRQQRFSPSFGFNGAPELAAYGDPVNLVYTNKNHNPEGGVRVAGSLVWSAIDNFGSAQFMQLLFVIGASRIVALDEKRTAFGSLAIDQIDPATAFLFYKDGGAGRPPKFKDRIYGTLSLYPESLRRLEDQEVCQITTARQDERTGTSGFSQAYSPTTSSVLGVFDPIPVNVEMYTRDGEGEEESAPIGVVVDKNDWSSADHRYKKGNVIQVKFESSDYAVGDKPARSLARDFRRQAVDSLDFGSTYMLGAASFRLTNFSNFSNPDDGEVRATFKCIKDGFCPSADYNKTKQRQEFETRKQQIERHQVILDNTFTEEEDDANPPTSENGNAYSYTTSADNNAESLEDQYVTTGFSISFGLGGANLSYNFENKRTVEWINELDERKTKIIDPAGSLEYTKYLESEAADNFPTISGKEAREELNSDLRKANRLVAEIQAGDYDDSTKSMAILGNRSLSQIIDEALTIEEITGRISFYNGKIEEQLAEKKNLRARIKKNGIKFSRRVKSDALQGKGDERTVRFPNYTDLTGDGLEVANRFLRLEAKITRWRNQITKVTNQVVNFARNRLVAQLLDFDGRFVDIKGNEYAFGGIAQMEERKDNFPTNKKIPDVVGVKAIGAEFSRIKRQKSGAERTINYFLANWEDLVEQEDNNFFVKALVKAESASYETISEVDHVKFSIKSKLYRKIAGRQKKYGEIRASKKYKLSDNGIKGRQAFFRFSYKKASEEEYQTHDTLFILRHSSEVDIYSDFNFIAPTRDKYAFKIEPVYDVASEIKEHGQSNFALLENHSTKKSHKDTGSAGATVWWNGDEYASVDRNGFPALEERGPKLTNEWDIFSVHTDTQVQFSFDNGPELALTAVTEQQIQDTEKAYKSLSILSLNMFAGRGIQDLRNVTAFATQGKESYRVDDFTQPFQGESTSFAPDIFVDTVLDRDNGIGKYAPSSSLDQESLKLAKLFCQNNNLPVEEGSKIELFMDGVIADNSAWREFWVGTAPFSLLEFARKNGKETLIPALPCNSDGKAARNDGLPISLTISALFTTGNILQDSYKEEFLDYGASTQDLIASIVYREESTKAVFQRKRTVDVKRADVPDSGKTKAIRETFDVSSFVTTRQQAILFGKMLVNQRRFIRRGIEFKTFPSVNPVEPGAFIYVDIGLTNWERQSSGVIGEGGALNSPLQDNIPNNTYNFLIYDRDASKVSASNSVAVSNGVASSLANKAKSLYVMGIDSGKKRVFRITEVELDEEGEVTVRAIEYPCDESDRARVADFRPELFDVS